MIRRIIAVTALAFLMASRVIAETSDVARTEVVENDFKKNFGETSRRAWDGDILRTLVGRTSTIANAGRFANVVLDALKPFLGRPTPHLVLGRRVDTLGGVHYEFTQVVSAEAVENVSLYVDVSRDDAIVGVTNRAEPSLKMLEVGEPISEKAAQCYAADDILGTVSNCDDRSSQGTRMPEGADALQFKVSEVFYAEPPWVRPAFAVEVMSSTYPVVVRRYVIDAETGKRLEQRDRVHDFEGHALVFNPNPFTDPAVHNMYDLKPTSMAYECARLRRIAPTASDNVSLRGDYVFITNTVESPDGVFDQRRGSAGFAAGMAYFHIDAMQDYVQTLGFRDICDRPIKVDVKAFQGSNAYYKNYPVGFGSLQFAFLDDGSGKLLFVAEDGDVIAHEYGHALQSSQALGKYDKIGGHTRAMYEGFGDYWAMSYFDVINGRNGFDSRCLGEWMRRAAGVFSDCRRTVDLAATIKTFNSTKDEHYNATVWTAALWAIHRKLGGSTADRIILQSHYAVPDGPSFADGARAIFTADEALNKGLNSSALCVAFVRRGILNQQDCKPLP